ncbi:hypothetical protein Y032_0677g1437 [Ancylostoma ceylanicum]|uniref:Thioredoxin domain-containing protein 17 n=1 Tax=Ancylostoma ceylanicum TaxID=53326 RepID=A0A016WHI1_9BILA|nr:hypothetical protein Y032_0677g1437 [Ancylostoma ceylanicum]
MREVIVEGYDAIRKELTSLSGQVFVLFTGSKVDGKSWCPDCVAAEPVIDSILHGNEGKSLDATFVTCYVGAREYWKDPACPFRTDKDFKLTCVPTLIEVGKKVCSLLFVTIHFSALHSFRCSTKDCWTVKLKTPA